MVKIRLLRMGRKNRCFYRIAVHDSRTRRDGKYIENVGTYDPLEKDFSKAVSIKNERIGYWLGVGAQPSPTVRTLLKKCGVLKGGEGAKTAAQGEVGGAPVAEQSPGGPGPQGV